MYIRFQTWLGEIMAIILTLVSSEVTAFLVFYYKMLGINFFKLRLTFFFLEYTVLYLHHCYHALASSQATEPHFWQT